METCTLQEVSFFLKRPKLLMLTIINKTVSIINMFMIIFLAELVVKVQGS
jgi:hypothetical protein